MDIGPTGQLRRKLLKTSFKLILKYAVPDQIAFATYNAQFEQTATKRDFGFMKKLGRHELEHYCDEKGYKGLDKLYAVWEFNDNEIDYFNSLKPTMAKFRSMIKDEIYNILKVRKNLFELAKALDSELKKVHKKLKPKTIANMVQYFYRTPNSSWFYQLWGIKRRKIVHDQEEADEVYALTESDEDS